MNIDTPKHRCTECGSIEFMTGLNAYDIYRAEGDALCYQRTEITYGVEEYFCRECSAKLADKNPRVI